MKFFHMKSIKYEFFKRQKLSNQNKENLTLSQSCYTTKLHIDQSYKCLIALFFWLHLIALFPNTFSTNCDYIHFETKIHQGMPSPR